MIRFLKNSFVLAAVLTVAGSVSSAKAATFDISWTGSDGYSLTGQFSFSDALLGTGVIDASSLSSFNIEGFLGAASVGTWDYFADGAVGADVVNINFDTDALQFVVGGLSYEPGGQMWGVGNGGGTCEASGLGLQAATAAKASVSQVPFQDSSLSAVRR